MKISLSSLRMCALHFTRILVNRIQALKSILSKSDIDNSFEIFKSQFILLKSILYKHSVKSGQTYSELIRQTTRNSIII